MNSGISVFADVKSRPAKRKLLLTGGRKENGRQTEGHENMEMCGDCGSLDDDYYWPANINNTVDSNPVLSSSNAPTDTAEVLPLSDEDEDKEEEMLLAQFFTNTLYNILERNDDDDATDVPFWLIKLSCIILHRTFHSTAMFKEHIRMAVTRTHMNG